MKNALTRFREADSFIAGILIGLSMLATVFAMTVVDSGDWHILWVFGAPILLALGLTLQRVVLAKAGYVPMTAPEPGGSIALRESP